MSNGKVKHVNIMQYIEGYGCCNHNYLPRTPISSPSIAVLIFV